MEKEKSDSSKGEDGGAKTVPDPGFDSKCPFRLVEPLVLTKTEEKDIPLDAVQLYLKKPHGFITSIYVRPSETVDELKERVMKLFKIHRALEDLIYLRLDGKQLDPKLLQTVGDAGLQAQATLTVSGRVRGGANDSCQFVNSRTGKRCDPKNKIDPCYAFVGSRFGETGWYLCSTHGKRKLDKTPEPRRTEFRSMMNLMRKRCEAEAKQRYEQEAEYRVAGVDWYEVELQHARRKYVRDNASPSAYFSSVAAAAAAPERRQGPTVSAVEDDGPIVAKVDEPKVEEVENDDDQADDMEEDTDQTAYGLEEVSKALVALNLSEGTASTEAIVAATSQQLVGYQEQQAVVAAGQQHALVQSGRFVQAQQPQQQQQQTYHQQVQEQQQLQQQQQRLVVAEQLTPQQQQALNGGNPQLQMIAQVQVREKNAKHAHCPPDAQCCRTADALGLWWELVNFTLHPNNIIALSVVHPQGKCFCSCDHPLAPGSVVLGVPCRVYDGHFLLLRESCLTNFFSSWQKSWWRPQCPICRQAPAEVVPAQHQ